MILTWSIIQLPAASRPERADDELFFTSDELVAIYRAEERKASMEAGSEVSSAKGLKERMGQIGRISALSGVGKHSQSTWITSAVTLSRAPLAKEASTRQRAGPADEGARRSSTRWWS